MFVNLIKLQQRLTNNTELRSQQHWYEKQIDLKNLLLTLL